MQPAVQLGDEGEALAHGVRAGHAAALETQAREEHVGLDDPLQVVIDHLRPHGLNRGFPVAADQIVAELGQGQRGLGRPAGEEVLCARGQALPGLEMGGQGVAHAGDEEAYRGLGDDLGVHEHGVGVAVEEARPDERAVGIVGHDHPAGGRVVGGHRRHHDHRQAEQELDRLGQVEDLAAAQAHGEIAGLVPGRGNHGLDGLGRDFATVLEEFGAEAGGGQGGVDPRAEGGAAEGIGHHQGFAAEHGRGFSEPVQQPGPLTVDLGEADGDHDVPFRRLLSLRVAPRRQGRGAVAGGGDGEAIPCSRPAAWPARHSRA